MGAIHLETVFTRIARAGDESLPNGLAGIERQFLTRQTEHTFHDILRLWSLEGNLSVKITTILQVDVEAGSMLLHPRPVFIDIGSIDDEEEVVLAQLIHQQIIDSSAILIAHHTIIDFPNRGTGDVVGEYMLDITLSILTLDRHFAHV